MSEFSRMSNFLSLDLSNALATIDLANIPTEIDCFDDVSSLAAIHCPHLSINRDSPSLEKFSVMSSPGRYTTVRLGKSRSLIAFSVFPLVDGYRKNEFALAPGIVIIQSYSK